MSRLDDDAWVRPRLERARGGDREALAELLTEAQPSLLQQIQPRIPPGNHFVDAADVLQATFIGAFLKINGFTGADTANFMTWLRELSERGLADELSRWTIIDRALRPPTPPPLPFGQPPLDTAARRALMLALKHLPPRYRRVLELRYLEDRSPEAAAVALHMSAAAAKFLEHRALVALSRVFPYALDP